METRNKIKLNKYNVSNQKEERDTPGSIAKSNQKQKTKKRGSKWKQK